MAKQNTIKRLLSYLFDFSLESRSSAINKTLNVVLSQGRIRLDSENATYSFEDKYRTFHTSFQNTKMADKRLDKILVLGLGLGSIPIMLEKSFDQNLHKIVGVELDPEVINLAEKYMPAELVAKSEFICEDASIFQTDQQFDLVAFDVFLDDETPASFRSKNYLLRLKKSLNSEGLIFYNTLKYTHDLDMQSKGFYEETFKKVFPSAFTIETNGNRMLVGGLKDS